jgi:hypothetical protein
MAAALRSLGARRFQKPNCEILSRIYSFQLAAPKVLWEVVASQPNCGILSRNFSFELAPTKKRARGSRRFENQIAGFFPALALLESAAIFGAWREKGARGACASRVGLA